MTVMYDEPSDDELFRAVLGEDDPEPEPVVEDKSSQVRKPKASQPTITSAGVALAARRQPFLDAAEALMAEKAELEAQAEALADKHDIDSATQRAIILGSPDREGKVQALQAQIDYQLQRARFEGVDDDEILGSHLGSPALAELEKAERELRIAHEEYPPKDGAGGVKIPSHVEQLAQDKVNEIQGRINEAQREADRRYSNQVLGQIRSERAIERAEAKAKEADAKYIQDIRAEGWAEWDVKAVEARQEQPYSERHAKDWAKLVSKERADIDAQAAGPNEWIDHRYGKGYKLSAYEIADLQQRGEVDLAFAAKQAGRISQHGENAEASEGSEGGEGGEGAA